jgi:F0F1-type ATP synthase delta subunit
MKNRTVLRLPVDTETAQYVLEKLFEREELAEQTIEVIQSFTKGKVRPFVAAQYDYLTTKLDSAQIARLYTDFAPHDVQLLQPSSYEAILNAAGESEQLEKILKRIEIELSVAQRNEEHNQVLRNVKDKLANLPVKEPVQAEAEQA